MTARLRRFAGGFAALLALGSAAPAAARSAAVEQTLDAAVAEASVAFRLPASWLNAVIVAESGGDRFAVSSAGAMGLMQLMPATWLELRARLGLGPDPFGVRDNVFAGAAYLREMLDRFGAPGFLAAYNAGPSRYARALVGRALLPPETRGYLARLAPVVGAGAEAPSAEPGDWRRAGLFAVPRDLAAADRAPTDDGQALRPRPASAPRGER